MSEKLLQLSRQALTDKRWDDVMSFGREALASSDIDDLTFVNVGIAVRDSGHFDLADDIFRKLIENSPSFRFPYYELAFSLLMQGKSDESSLLLSGYMKDWPDDIRVGLLLIKALHFSGAHAEADAAMERLPVVGSQIRSICLHQSFGNFLRTYPIARMRLLVKSVAQKSPMMSPKDVAQLLMTAKQKRSPFSLIRLGDGEGTCIRLNALDEAIYQPLYEDNRSQFRNYWFGEGIIGIEDKFEQATSELVVAIQEADIVGLPLPGWLDHEYKIGSSRGVSSLVNVYRLIASMQASAHIHQCAQSVHIDLGKMNFFDEFLADEKRIGLVSCFQELPEQISSRFKVSDIDFYKIPGEQYFKDVIGDEATAGRHFPETFNHIMSALQNNCKNKIVLIAAGILGKLYSREVKRGGGIAVDIGSLADAWVRKATRPGYEQLGGLALR